MSNIVNHADINFDDATPVVSVAKKFVIPVGKFEQDNGGESLVYPTGHSKAGQPITDYEGKALGEKGIVFQNRAESVAAAPSDGNSVMIINQVSNEDAAKLQTKINELGGDPSKLSLAQFKEVLSYAKSLGYEDIYNSNLDFQAKKFKSENEIDTKDIPGYSFGLRNDRVEGKKVVAKYLAGDITFKGQSQAAGGEQNHPNGAIVVFDSSAPAGDQIRTIDAAPKELDSYRLADRSKIILEGPNANIAKHVPTQGVGGEVTSPEKKHGVA